VHCRPLKETHAAANLKETLGLPVFLPEVRKRSRGKEQLALLFPRYLFVQANLHEVKLSSINSTPGVVRLLDFGGGPLPISHSMVSEIRERVESLNEQGGLPAHNFRPGDTVWLKSGPLRGLHAVFVGPMTPSARVKVLLHFLGRLNEVQVDVETLERKPDPPRALEERSPRGTRGRGRAVNRANRYQS
jgi:transcriptional antiterminator RfaH